jgi:hypothetical protein
MPIKNVGKTGKDTPPRKKKAAERRGVNRPQSANQIESLQNAAGNTHQANKKGGWTFLTNHSHVIILLANKPDMVIREVAAQIGITERAVQRIIVDLEEDGFLIREKVGRQNHYHVARNLPLRHPIEQHRNIGDLLDLILNPRQ